MLVKDASPTNNAKLYNYNYIPGIASIYKTFIAFFSLYVTSPFHHSCLETTLLDRPIHNYANKLYVDDLMEKSGFARHGIIINGVC